MPEERDMSAPAGAADGSASATGTTAPPATDESANGAVEPQETAEQKLARVESELKNERALRLSHQEKVEELHRLRAEREAQAAAQPTTAGVASNPLDQAIAGLEDDAAYWREQKALAQTPQAKREVEALERNALVQRALLMEKKQQQVVNAAHAAAKPAFERDTRYGARAEQLWLQGRAATPEDAILLAKGEAAGQPDPAARAQEAADEAARRAMASKPSTSARPVTAAENERRKMTLDEFNAKVASGDKKLSAAADRGEIDIE